ncbi:MAG TPA: colicin D domain-containing protein [Galbitalea sp.]
MIDVDKFKHASAVGVRRDCNPKKAAAYGDALEAFVNDAGTIRVKGTFRGSDSVLNYNPTTGTVVVQKEDGTFVTTFVMSEKQLANVVQRRSLGGS